MNTDYSCIYDVSMMPKSVRFFDFCFGSYTKAYFETKFAARQNLKALYRIPLSVLWQCSNYWDKKDETNSADSDQTAP